MLNRIRRPSHATVVAYLALFVALGGSSYAAIKIGSAQITNNSVRSADLRNNDIRGRDVRQNTLTGADISERKLGTVPRATTATTLGGLTASALKVRCPAGTTPASGACMESSARPPQSLQVATDVCALAGRRLPAFDELVPFVGVARPLGAGGELTSNVAESRTTAGQLDVTVVLDALGTSVAFQNANGPAPRAFRCVATPTN